MYTAEIISIGTELLWGEITDTNAVFLAQQLVRRGLTVHHKSVVGDDLPRIKAVLSTAVSRADLVLVSGGLGPTDDDLTREAIAVVLNETPQEHPELLRDLQAFFERKNRPMSPLNRKQAWLIPSADSLPNRLGTAPGWWVRTQESVIVALPGPPRELQTMWHEQVVPRLPPAASAIAHTTIHTTGIGESDLAQRLQGMSFDSAVTIGTYARDLGVDVRISATAATLEQANELILPCVSETESRLENWIWGKDRQALGKIIAQKLGENRLGVIDCLGGGLCAALFAQRLPFEALIIKTNALCEWGWITQHQTPEEIASIVAIKGQQCGQLEVLLSATQEADTVYLALRTIRQKRVQTLCQVTDHKQIASVALQLLYRTLQEEETL